MTNDRALEWLAQDPDPETRRELQRLVDEPSRSAELAERFASVLQFGTAGLRGVLGAGPMRMNRVLVQKVSGGLAEYLLAHVENVKERGVVIGFDGRKNSQVFAEDTASVLLGKGIRVLWSTAMVPTPVVAFGVSHYRAAAGVMVTASHNPPEYNGYKVFSDSGAQILPGAAAGISTEMAKVKHIESLTHMSVEDGYNSGLLKDVGADLMSRYLDGVCTLGVHNGIFEEVSLTVAYTPMHGVGADCLRRALTQVGLHTLHIEPTQEKPNGEFPTVRFPNPEEEGAMDLVFALAKRVDADLVLANDPDADRLAVAVPIGDGEFQRLSGDQVGILLADYLLRYGPTDDKRLVATTLVSSQLLECIAQAEGVSYQTTLTGMKWIADVAIKARELRDERFVMGYEEALGYCIGEFIRDKDGISAAVVFCELAAFAKSKSSSLLRRLDAIYRQHGVYLTTQHSLRFDGTDGADTIKALMSQFRKKPPAEISGYKVERYYDLQKDEMDLPKSDVLVFFLEKNQRVIMRPSGTEPKLKCYYEVREPVASGTSVTHAQQRAEVSLASLRDAHLEMFCLPA